ncbi:unnamed protein product [Prunus brigantina]
MWVRRHPFLLLVFSPKLEEERMGKGASQKAIGYFPKLLGHSFSLMLTHMFGPKKWARVLVLPRSPKLPLLGPSMGLVNARNHSCHNPLSKPQAFAWLGPT